MLGIAVEKVCDLITHIRAFDIKIPADYSRQSDATTEVSALEAVEDVGEEPVYDELASFIGALNEEEQINLVALTWLGRGDFSADDWESGLAAAKDARSDHTDTYLLGIPLLSDYLEEGLALSEAAIRPTVGTPRR